MKPYQLIDRKVVNNESEEDEQRPVMLEYGLHDVDNLHKDDNLEYETKEIIVANCVDEYHNSTQIQNHVS